MKLIAFLIYNDNKNLVYNYFDLRDMFLLYRNTAKNTVITIAKELLSKIEPLFYYIVVERGYKICCCYDNYYYVCICNEASENKEMYYMVNNIKKREIDVDKFNKICADPNKNQLNEIAQTIDETKIILLDALDKLLERGEKLDDLIEKTLQLNNTSLVFKNKSKNMNSCCIIL